uniref:SF3 helicase domain-containing protein n=1 Tax=viral metagenome TaxID=1070528 RepID=A0A6C0IC96_9ZZZZ
MKQVSSTHMSSSKFSEYLKKHYIRSASSSSLLDEQSVIQEKTNTRIADKSSGISGGTYHIPDPEYNDFIKLYYNEIYVKGQAEYLTEKQLTTGGPIVVDVDLRYDYEITERKHTKEHVVDLVCQYLEELKTMYQFDTDTHIPIFVFEKPSVNRVNSEGKEKITKDGIHMIIGLQADHTVQMILRKRIVEKIGEIWEGLPIKNTWSDVFDEGISKGCTNWQLYGSCKPNNATYRLKYVFDVHLDPEDGEFVMPEVKPSMYELSEDKFMQLSVRYRGHPSLFMTNTFITEYQEKKTGTTSSSSSSSSGISTDTQRYIQSNDMALRTVPMDILNIRTKEQLDMAIQQFLDSLAPTDFELREVYDYTMALPKSYYGSGSFTKWIRVGWALRNISFRLFIVWVAFSAQADGFSYTNIRSDLWEKWSGFDMKVVGEGLTKRSIMYWVKQDNPTKYKSVNENSVDYFIDMTLESCTMSANSSDKRSKGSGDYDIATVLHQLFRDEYKCVSVKANIWYRFKNHRWEEIDSGTTLRKAISVELRDIYSTKMGKLVRQRVQLKSQENQDNVDKLKFLQLRLDAVSDIMQRLARTNDKKNIMVEAKELFFDPLFLQKLDDNPYLLCFNNGVVDFKTKTFRRGLPEDYLSKCTKIDYHPIDPVRHATTVSEIKDFMQKLFPSPELHTYMWDHLASTLIGNNMNQTFNMYIGIGSNGKSILVNLMEQVLGDYKGDVPLTLLTQQRTRIGGLSPELVALKGVRYAVMQEPSKGDRINEGIMKQVTGGDPIQARAPYMPQMVNYIPQFKLVVCSNEFMELRSQDHGTRRRIRVVDFEALFSENPVTDDPDKPYQYKLDKTLREKFVVWREIFASMLVDIAYVMNGNVTDCPKVMASSNSYLDRQDFISEFMTERIEACENGCVQKSHLGREFQDWYSMNFGGKPPNTRDVSDAMDKRFGKMSCGVWRGIRFKQHGSIGSNHGDDNSTIHTHSHDFENENVEIDLNEL